MFLTIFFHKEDRKPRIPLGGVAEDIAVITVSVFCEV